MNPSFAYHDTKSQASTRPNLIRSALAVIAAHKQAYIILNVLYYAVVILGMVYVSTNPELQNELMEAIGQAFTEGPLASVGAAYGTGQVISASIQTFLVNLLIGSLATITVPSLFLPASGMLMGVYRAILWGLLLSPTDARLAGPMIPHSLTLILEGQAYIIAMLAAWVHARAFFSPKSVGETSHVRGYLQGLKQTGLLYLLITILLAVAAIYEALEVIYLAPLFY